MRGLDRQNRLTESLSYTDVIDFSRCHASDADHYCLHISSSCWAVAPPGSGPTRRRHVDVFEVAHESSAIRS